MESITVVYVRWHSFKSPSSLLLLPHPDLAVRGGVYRRRRLEMSFFHLANISCKPIPRRISRSIGVSQISALLRSYMYDIDL